MFRSHNELELARSLLLLHRKVVGRGRISKFRDMRACWYRPVDKPVNFAINTVCIDRKAPRQ